ncbi:MAG: hypothetical protein ABSH45_08780 [Bryobacteraceae bacterium]|jgi:hypothetical protein
MGLRKWIAWVVAGTVSSTLLGSAPVIGVVSAEGSFRLDNVAAVAHATLLDGTEIQSDASTPRLQLKDGAWLLLATSSRVKIGGRRMAIEQGTAEIGGAARYDLEAGTLHIKPANNRALVRVQVNGERQVLVAAAGAPALVYTGAGLLVAKVRDGATLSFDPQAGPATTAQVPGCLLSKGGRYIVVNLETKQVLEVTGPDASKEVGNRVLVTGTVVSGVTPVSPATEVIRIGILTHIDNGGCVAAAADVGADPLMHAPVQAPAASSHTTAYIVLGVAVAAGAIAGVAVVESGKKSSQ